MFHKFCWNCESFSLSNVKIKVFLRKMTVPEAYEQCTSYKILPVIFYFCVWLIMNLLPSSVSFLLRWDLQFFCNFYIEKKSLVRRCSNLFDVYGFYYFCCRSKMNFLQKLSRGISGKWRFMMLSCLRNQVIHDDTRGAGKVWRTS